MNLAAAILTFSLATADAQQSVRCHELNPVLRPVVSHPAAVYTVKLSSAAFVTWNVERLKKQGHPRWAWTLWVAVNVAQGAVVIHNARTK